MLASIVLPAAACTSPDDLHLDVVGSGTGAPPAGRRYQMRAYYARRELPEVA